MNTKKILATGAVVLSGLALVGAFAFAQSAISSMNLNINNSGQVHLAGTVSAVSGNVISVTSWGGTWQVTTTNAADVKVGDMVKVQGTVSAGMNINATKVVDTSIKNVAGFSGAISNLNVTAGTFTIATEHNGNVNVTTNSSTQVFLNGSVSALANLANGNNAAVAGSFNATTNTLTATTIRVPVPQKDNDNDNDNGWLHAMAKVKGFAWGLFGNH